MDENVLNLETRRFLKEVGITSQRKIEQAVRDALREGRLSGAETLRAEMTLVVEPLGLRHTIKPRSSSPERDARTRGAAPADEEMPWVRW